MRSKKLTTPKSILNAPTESLFVPLVARNSHHQSGLNTHLVSTFTSCMCFDGLTVAEWSLVYLTFSRAKRWLYVFGRRERLVFRWSVVLVFCYTQTCKSDVEAARQNSPTGKLSFLLFWCRYLTKNGFSCWINSDKQAMPSPSVQMWFDINKTLSYFFDSVAQLPVESVQERITTFHDSQSMSDTPIYFKYYTIQLTTKTRLLAALHGIDYCTPSITALAAKKVFRHRIVVAKPEDDRSLQYGSDFSTVSRVLAHVTPEEILDSVLALEAPLWVEPE